MPRLALCLLPVACWLAVGCARPRAGNTPDPEPAFPRPAEIQAEAWRHAVNAYQRAELRGLTRHRVLTLIDYTLPSTARRLWVVELGTSRVLMHEFVAHGSASGGTMATRFSNVNGSRSSSVGTFLTGGTYIGVRGLSRRLVGLEPGINDHAFQRGIVLHGTPAVSAASARLGRLGRTEGCPAVPKTSARRLINLVPEGSVVFVWYPDPTLLGISEYIAR